MPSDTFYALLLPRELSPGVLLWLAGYLHQTPEDQFLICSEVAVQGLFLHLMLLGNGDNKDSSNRWKVRLPVQYALAIVEMFDQEARPIGFLEKKK